MSEAEQLRISVARAADLPVVMEILDEAARWLLSRGIHQWESPPPDDAWELFRESVRAGLVYLLRLEPTGDPIGTFRIAWDGGSLWKPDSGDPGYLYSLAFRPAFIGRRLGVHVIDWLKGFFRERGKRRFRLDCIAANATLRGWYEALGFNYRGIAVDGTYRLALYELDLDAPPNPPSASHR